jgi:hypothetical protein
MTKIKLISIITAGLVSLLALLAFVLSYSSLQHMAAAHGVGPRLSYLWPLLLDFAMIVFSLAILRANLRQESARYPWTLAVIFAGLATLGNVLDVEAMAALLGIATIWISASVKALAPIALVLAFELLMKMVRAEIERAAITAGITVLVTERDTLAGVLDKLNGQIERQQAKLESIKADISTAKSVSVQQLQQARQDKIDQRRAEVLALLKEGYSEPDMATELDVSIKTIRRDIKALNGHGGDQ